MPTPSTPTTPSAHPAPTKIGPFTVEAEIGRGGMGVVYRGADPTLGRTVAIKALPSIWTKDADRVARLRREARTMASLTHPNLAAVHALVEQDGGLALVMEFAPGETLDARLRSGPLAVDDALRVCAQIAAGVEAAHEAGVVHRDLKPGNVMLGPDGSVKVLDFGLAKAPEGLSGSFSAAPDGVTVSTPVEAARTLPGVVLGTAPYMSPEQARGRSLDRRTDIWSFGCVLWESLTGRRVFDGETTTDVLAAIVEREPDWSSLPKHTPIRVRELLVKCLEKDQKKRLRDIGDARLELERALANREWSTSSLSAWPGAPAARRRLGAAWVVAALCALAAVGALAWALTRGPAGGAERVTYVDVTAPAGHVIDGPYLSPTGRHAVFWSRPDDQAEGTGAGDGWRLMLRSFDTGETREVPRSERPRFARFSPDGRFLAYIAGGGDGGQRTSLLRVPVDLSAQPVELATMDGSGFQAGGMIWTPSGEIVIHRGIAPGRIERYSAADGRDLGALALTLEDESMVSIERLSDLLPDNRTLLVQTWGYAQRGYVEIVAALDLTTGRVRTLVENAAQPRYDAPSGLLVFTRGGSVVAAPFDVGAQRVTGAIEVVQSGLRAEDSQAHGWVHLNESGDLAFFPGGVLARDRTLAIAERDGSLTEWSPEKRSFEGDQMYCVSADQRMIAAVIGSPEALYEIWCSDFDRPRLRKVAASAQADCGDPCLSSDGSLLAYTLFGEGRPRLCVVDPQRGVGAEPVATLESADGWLEAMAFVDGDSKLLVARYDMNAGEPGGALLLAGIDSPTMESRQIIGAAEGQSRFSPSPSGKWLACLAKGPEGDEVVIRRVGEGWAVGPPIPIAPCDDDDPMWFTPPAGADGRTADYEELAYRIGARVMTVRVPLVAGGAIGEPAALPALSEARRVRDVIGLPDGRFLVLLLGEDETLPTSFRVAQNWASLLRRGR